MITWCLTTDLVLTTMYRTGKKLFQRSLGLDSFRCSVQDSVRWENASLFNNKTLLDSMPDSTRSITPWL